MQKVRAEIDLGAIRANARRFAALAGGAALCAVVKADAYGHGVTRAAKILEECGIAWAAAGTLEEAAAIRDAGFSGNIVSLLCLAPGDDDIRLAREKNLTPLIHIKSFKNFM